MNDKNTAAERAAHLICQRWVDQDRVITFDRKVFTGVVQAAIDKSTADWQRQVADLAAVNEVRQRQIAGLVEALEEAQTSLIMEGYGVSPERSGHSVMEQINAALAPFKGSA